MPSIRRVLKGRLIKFGTVGFSGTLINLITLYLSQEYLFRGVESVERRLPLSLASAIFLATLNNFIWNRGWTWKDRKEQAGHEFFFPDGTIFPCERVCYWNSVSVYHSTFKGGALRSGQSFVNRDGRSS
jgi:hypothetical protein